MATVKKMKKAQKGQSVAPMRTFTKKDYNRKDSVPSEMFPGTMIPRSALQDVAPPRSTKSAVKKSIPKKKMKDGGSFGMLSVKAGVDKNPKPTAADRIAGAKMKAGKMKSGGKMKKCKYGCK